MNKEEIRHFKSLLREGSLRHMNILLDDKFQSELLNIIKDYEKLQQENQNLKERIAYLEKSNDRREDTILELRNQLSFIDEQNKHIAKLEKQNKFLMERENKLQVIEMKQKEFIKYLEDEIHKIEPKGTSINFNCEYDSEDDYINAMEEQSKLITLKRNLSKYKEIIGGKE